MELNDLELGKLKTEYINLLKSTKREGIDNLINFLEKSDFFMAPASTRFHGSFKGGLLMHSLNVYYEFMHLKNANIFPICDIENDSFIICALLHDICKTYFYTEDTRNVKNKETGQWEQVPFYSIDNKIPYGHGEKSVMMVSEYIQLKPFERMAIRWHMGFSEPKEMYNDVGLAFEKYPFAMVLHFADMAASHILEVE